MDTSPHTSLSNLISLLAQDAISTQLTFDAAYVAARKLHDSARQVIEDGAKLHAQATRSVEDWRRAFVYALHEQLTPPLLCVESFELDLRVAVAVSSETGGSVQVTPLNMGYDLRYGSSVEHSSKIRLQVVSAPVETREATTDGG